MKTDSLRDLFFDQLHDILSMESQLVSAMPRLVPLCHDRDLRELVSEHAAETVQHRAAVIQILEDNGVDIEDDECKAMAGLIEGGEEHLNQVDEPHTRDMMMIAHCLRIEHYEIAAYEITIRLGEWLGMHADVEKLQGTLHQERAAARSLDEMESHLLEATNSRP